jgi:ABC-type molybdenum transport system ATPase subunit/photorepair protein PhrA
LETYQSLQEKVDIHPSEPEKMKQSKSLKRDLEAISTRSQKQLARVIKTRDAVFSGGKKSIGDYASKVMSTAS